MIENDYPEIVSYEMLQDPSQLPEAGDLLFGDPDRHLNEDDLKEMQAVLYAGERHAAVTPRTTLPGYTSSFPVEPLAEKHQLSLKELETAHARMISLLPRYTVLQEVSPFPLLVRGDLIRRFQNFMKRPLSDPRAFTEWSKYGYSLLVANRVLTHHASNGNPKLQTTRKHLTPEHSLIEGFVPLFSNSSSTRLRVLLDFTSLRPYFNGTAEYGLAMLKQLTQNHKPDVALTAIATVEAAEFHQLEKYVDTLMIPGAPLGVYDIGFTFSHMISRSQWNLLCTQCLKVCITVLDIIWIRCTPLSNPNPSTLRFFHEMFRQTDGILTISQAVKNDLFAYMPELQKVPDLVVEHVLPAVSTKQTAPLPSQNTTGPVLLVGNDYAHKALPEAIEALKGLSQPLIVFGMKENHLTYPPSVTFVPGGHLPDNEVQELFQSSAVLVYPSQYEGFGIPLARALSLGKPCVVFDTPTNREVVDRFAVTEGQVHFCNYFSDLKNAVETSVHTTSTQKISRPLRYWEDVAVETVAVWQKVHKTQLNHSRFQQRINSARSEQEFDLHRKARDHKPFSIKTLIKNNLKKPFAR